MHDMYHGGNRELQDQFGSTALADRLIEITHRTAFNDNDRAFIEGATFFFMATADAKGRPDCSFKGGPAGFVKVVGDNELVIPDYDGNGMFKSLGNIRANPNVGLLFIAMSESPKRLRVNGAATLELDPQACAAHLGAQALIRVTARHVFPNCPRYIPDLATGAPSRYLPEKDRAPVEPAWKSFDHFKD
ncbi:MAG: pyridoxamine 5'-phosphate oxidase family protein, partial [Rhodobacteraceae bacterium]|nr:pyridoxamine 5'-phosphate oxidase family protein [Paracoccaceae bacterium]